VLVGHVDHGKSTLIGRLLHDTNSLTEGAVEKVRKICQDKGVDFEYAYLLDALQEEQEQGITIDITKIEFSTPKRHYTIIDAPGHKEFLKNMISGASNAEAAILIIDAAEGVKEQTKKHAYLLSLLGIKQVYAVVNKMDLVNYSQHRFEEVKNQAAKYLQKLGIFTQKYIPIAAKKGDNVTYRSDNMPWYVGPTILQAIDDFVKEPGLEQKPLRFPVQDVYKFDQRRIIAGRLESGSLMVGDEIIVLPSQKKSKIRTLESWQQKDKTSSAATGQCIGITIEDEYF